MVQYQRLATFPGYFSQTDLTARAIKCEVRGAFFKDVFGEDGAQWKGTALGSDALDLVTEGELLIQKGAAGFYVFRGCRGGPLEEGRVWGWW